MSDFVSGALQAKLQSAIDDVSKAGFTVVMSDGQVRVIADDAPVKALPAPKEIETEPVPSKEKHPGKCSEPGCARNLVARGMCGRHYSRWLYEKKHPKK